MARADIMGYIEKAAQRHRLKKNGLDNVIEYCHTTDLTTIIPVLKENCLVNIKDL
jgi:2-phosphosulfolactate phosphatase